MRQQRYSRITVHFSDSFSWVLYNSPDAASASIEEDVLFNNITGLPHDEGVIIYNPESDTEGVSPFALFENITYRWDLSGDKSGGVIKLKSPLAETGGAKSGWNISLDGIHGDFTVRNYLGSSYISIEKEESPFFQFDVISRKLDYYTEYRNLVEAVAEQCSQLLLEWDSPVHFSFTPDPEKEKRIILEQFLFLRHVLKPENLQLYLEVIGRNPDNSLSDEAQWKTAGAAYDSDIYIDPVSNGRGWHRSGPVASLLPDEVLVRSREETLNTPANRFIKYALNIFREVTLHVIELLEKENNPYQTPLIEARSMLNTLDVFLAQPFFREVEVLSYIPYNSQVLQKREGYRQILHAWLMLEAASRLDWQGKNEAYEGTNRNAAVLYEYWLYFVLFSIIRSIAGFTLIQKGQSDAVSEFIAVNNEGMTVNLKSGQQSKSSFRSEKMNINLYYNRPFPGTGLQNESVIRFFQSGSYSRRLVPDYSIAVFPVSMDEDEAENKGLTVWLHFDAKYRAEVFSEIFGLDTPAETELEKQERAYSVYKLGDLYKMHTYNEAIRRTAGSYVLYPGSADQNKRPNFPKYHEILPGVGAFSVRPDENADLNAEGASDLKGFIEDVIKTHINNYTDHYRINYWTNDTVARDEHSRFITDNKKPAADITVAVIPLRDDELLDKCLECGYFFFHSEYRGGREQIKNRELLNADYIMPVNMHTGMTYNSLFRIIDADSAGRDRVKKDLNSRFFKGTAEIYFRCFIENEPIKIELKYKHSGFHPVIKTWKELSSGSRA